MKNKDSAAKIQVPIDETNISNSYDRSSKFKKAENTKQWLDVTNGKFLIVFLTEKSRLEHFIVWN